MLKTLTLVSSIALLAACSGEAPSAANPQAAPAGGAMSGPPAGGGNAMGGGMGAPDFTATAATLGIDVDTLNAALRDAGGPPPDLAIVAEKLGISVEALTAAMPPRPE